MKPRELYSGPAPAAMGMMGQGLLETGANIGRSLQQGYESMGSGLAGGISGFAGQYQEHQKEAAAVKGGEKFLDFLGNTALKTNAINQDQFDMMKTMLADPSLSTRDKAQMLPMVSGALSNQILNKQALDKLGMQLEVERQKPFSQAAAAMMSNAGYPVNSRLGVSGGRVPSSSDQNVQTVTGDTHGGSFDGETISPYDSQVAPSVPDRTRTGRPVKLDLNGLPMDDQAQAPYMISRPPDFSLFGGIAPR